MEKSGKCLIKELESAKNAREKVARMLKDVPNARGRVASFKWFKSGQVLISKFKENVRSVMAREK